MAPSAQRKACSGARPLLDGARALRIREGWAGLYHETITWAYLLLIRERMERGPRDAEWEEFASANPDLLVWKPSVLDRYHTPETLGSDLARCVCLLPDR